MDVKRTAIRSAKAFQTREVFGQNRLVGAAGVNGGDDRLVGGEPGEIVDMTVGVIAFDAVFEPEDLGRSQGLAEAVLDVYLGKRGIPVGVEQDSLGGEELPIAVDLNGSSFQNHPAVNQWKVEGFCDEIGNGIIEIVWVELVAPAIEAPTGEGNPAVCVLHEKRPVIATPHVVGGMRVQAQAFVLTSGGQEFLSDVIVQVSRSIDIDEFKAGDGGRYFGELAFETLEFAIPEIVTMGPGKPDGFLWGPFGWHAVTTWHGGIKKRNIPEGKARMGLDFCEWLADLSPMKIALLQSRAFATRKEALQHHLGLIRKAAEGGAQVICTQELFLTEYFCDIQEPERFDLAEKIPGPTVEALRELAALLEVVIVASLFERRGAGLYHNTAVVIDADGNLTGIYRKNHIPQDPGFEEKFYFTPGDTGYPVWDTRYGKLGVLICWDQWYPEAARLMALGGAEVIIYPTAIGWLPEEKEDLGEAQHVAWETVQRGHAVANGCYVAAINRVGREKGTEFWGQSFVADPYGRVVARAGVGDEEILFHECDRKLLEETRRIWPFFRDRRIETYGGLTKRWLAE